MRETTEEGERRKEKKSNEERKGKKTEREEKESTTTDTYCVSSCAHHRRESESERKLRRGDETVGVSRKEWRCSQESSLKRYPCVIAPCPESFPTCDWAIAELSDCLKRDSTEIHNTNVP
ncbi:hypothetical protein ACT7DL_17775 [Bacillus paranthracis]